MAKQSGLHQLKGKVEGYSYYRQSGVKDGLMRRINEGMSSRVKTSEEFANTRLNCSEFGNAADVAKVLASVITPKFRPMFLNFSQAKLTKSLLALIKQATGDWGQRALAASDVQAVCDAVNMLAKNDFAALCSDFTSAAGSSTGNTSVSFGLTEDNGNSLEAAGADGINLKFASVAVYAGQYSENDHAYKKSLATVLGVDLEDKDINDIPDSDTIDLLAKGDTIPGTTQLQIILAIAMPYRVINGKTYTLQEKCTFKMIPAVVAE